MACTWTSSSVSTGALIASVSTALVGRQGLQQPLGLPVVLGPAGHSMLAWLRCPPCSAMNTVSTTSLDWTPPPGEPSPSLRRPQDPDDVEIASFPLISPLACRGVCNFTARPQGVTTKQTDAHNMGREERRALLEQRRAAVVGQSRRLAIELTDLDRQLDETEHSER